MLDNSLSFFPNYIFDDDHQRHSFKVLYNQMILLSIKIKVFLILHALYD